MTADTLLRAEIETNHSLLSKPSLEGINLQIDAISKIVILDRFCQYHCCYSERQISGTSYSVILPESSSAFSY